jgi:hypothetical protein
MLRGWATFVGLEALIALQFWLAHADRFLTVREMQERGIAQGLPLIWHFGIWGDIFIVSGLAAYIVGRFSERWAWRSIITAAVFTIPTTLALAWIFTWSGTPEAHIQDHRITSTGIVHLVYTYATLSILVLFFFFTSGLSNSIILAIGVPLIFHMTLGTHMVLGLINLNTPFAWYPDNPLGSISGWMMIGVATVALAVRVTVFGERSHLADVVVEKWSGEDHSLEKFHRVLMQSIRALPSPIADERVLVYRKARQGLQRVQREVSPEDFEIMQLSLEGAIQRIEDSFPDRYRWFHRVLGLSGNKLSTVEGRLKTFDYLCDFIAVGALFKIFRYNLNVAEYFSNGLFDPQSYMRFASDHGLTTALLAAVLGVYYLSRRCVKTELTIVRQLFSPSRLPQNWTYVVGGGEIAKLILGYMFTYLTIAWFIDDVRIVAAAFVIIFCINYRNMKLTRATLSSYLVQSSLEPAASDEHREFILRRRDVARDYIFGKWHLEKESAGAMGSGVALLLAIAGYAFHMDGFVVAATIVMILTLVINEVIVYRWRVIRGQKLAAIEQDQIVSDRMRTGGI